MLDWNDLRYVLETARQGGISGAARVLGVNHATVARRITAAEEALGARLFDRLPTGYVATEAGQEAVETALQIETAGNRLDLRIAARDAGLGGPLTVTAPQLFIDRVLAPLFARFTQTYPEIELTVLATNDMLNLPRRQADIAIRITRAPPASLVGWRVAEQRAAIYATPELIAQDRGGAAPLDWIRFTHWPGPPEAVRARRPNLRVRLSVDDMIAAIAAARAGIGATRMACFLGESDPALARVPELPDFDYVPIWVLTHPDLRHVPRIRAFADFMAAELRALRPLFLGQDFSAN